jgi:lipopolysaccharide transport system permease protein
VTNKTREAYFVRIKPNSSLGTFNWRQFWDYRELMYLLVWRDIKVRYRQTLLGFLWAVLQPLSSAVIVTVILSSFVPPDDTVPYWLFALSGFTFWVFFSSSVAFGSGSLVHHKELVTKIFFPRMIVPVAAVGGYFLDLLLTVLILFGGMIYYGTAVTWKIVLLPLFLLFFLVLTISVSILLAALNVRFRDIKFVIPFLLQLGLFVSPVFYPPQWVAEKWRYVFAFNPISGCLNGFRNVLFGTPLDSTALVISIVVTAVLFLVAMITFRKMEDDFGDLL